MKTSLIPKISIIITCYNDGDFIEEAIESVRLSTISNWEIIIVDDFSTDLNTQDKLRELKSKGYQVLQLAKNQGVGNARNKGIQNARGEYILPLDADDRILPTYLEKACSALDKHLNAAVIYCNVKRFGDKDTIRIAPDFNFKTLLAGNYIASCSVFRKIFWEKCGGYDVKMPNYEDWEFWISVAEKGKHFIHLNEVLFEYRSRNGSKISKTKIAEHRANVVKYICNKHMHSYMDNINDIVPILHSVIASNEELLNKQTDMIGDENIAKIFEKYRAVEEELVSVKEYYENSFYIKIKKIVDKLKPIFFNHK